MLRNRRVIQKPEQPIAANETQAARHDTDAHRMPEIHPTQAIMSDYSRFLGGFALSRVAVAYLLQQVDIFGQARLTVIGLLLTVASGIVALAALTNFIYVWNTLRYELRPTDTEILLCFMDAFDQLRLALLLDFLSCVFVTLGAAINQDWWDMQKGLAGLVARAGAWVFWREYHIRGTAKKHTFEEYLAAIRQRGFN